MFKKWKANCEADRNLWLRNNVFYYIVELPRVNGKRKYIRQSLHTKNCYEAMEKAKSLDMINKPEPIFNDIRRLLNSLIFETNQGEVGYLYAQTNIKNAKLSKRNKYDDVSQLLLSYHIVSRPTQNALTPEQSSLLDQLANIMPLLQDFLTKASQPLKQTVMQIKISKVLDDWLHNANTGKATEDRRRNAVAKMLSDVGLTLDDDYSKFHDINVFKSVSNNVMAMTNGNNSKRLYISYIEAMAKIGTMLDSDNYKPNVLLGLPKIAKTDDQDTDPHLPYSQDQLLNIFNPKHKFFKDNTDTFFACMIALFTGARLNVATTLQYDNIINQDGIDCIQFTKDHDIKKLKNGATKRIVPINKQLLDMGFLDYIKRHKTKSKATGTGFIFPACCTKGGNFNNKFTLYLTKFLMDIGVKKDSNDGYNFHSFRNNASLIMQDAGISDSYINKIIGWKGKSTMQKHYSKHDLTQINNQVDKFRYDFLQSHFDAWKLIMAKK